MDEKKLIEAAKMLKEYCASMECDNCLFINGLHCPLEEDGAPKYWSIPKPRRWTDADIALAKALNTFGAQYIGGRGSVKFAYCIDGGCYAMPTVAFANLNANEEIAIDEIIAEGETG